MEHRSTQTILITEPSIGESFDSGRGVPPISVETRPEDSSMKCGDHLLSPNKARALSRRISSDRSSDDGSSASSNSTSSVSSSSPRNFFFGMFYGTARLFQKEMRSKTPPASRTPIEQSACTAMYSLRRSKSAGNDVPLYAQFLGEKPISKTRTSEAKPFDAEEDAFARKKHTSSGLRQRFRCLGNKQSTVAMGSVRPTPEEAKSWAASFQDLLASKYGTTLFRAFLRREHSEENLDFWLACEAFKSCRPSKLQSRGLKMYSKYVALNAPHEVNVEMEARNKILSDLERAPTKECFDSVQKKVRVMLENDAYPRFLRCNLFLELAYPEGEMAAVADENPSLKFEIGRPDET